MADSADEIIGVLSDDPTDDLAGPAPDSSHVITGSVDDVYAHDPTVVIAVGPNELRTALETDRTTPILPFDIDASFEANDTLDTVIDTIRDGGWTASRHRVIDVTTPDATVPALLDATVMTTAPGSISEYEIGGNNDFATDGIRADGIVVTTPLGSTGYPTAAGGPTITSTTDAVAIVPVSPFSVARETWVTTPPVQVTVRRDESAVTLYADGAAITPLADGGTADITWGGDAVVATLSPTDEKT